MAKPYHAKVRTMFERIMKEDNSVYTELYRPDATRVVWFGADSGKVQKPADALPFPRKGGPLKYYNRKQYLGDHVFVETHDAVYEETDDRVHPKLKGTSMPALVLCTLDDEGLITHFEEFLDPAFLAKGKRPVPAPATPPDQVSVFTAPGDAAQNKAMVTELFHNVANWKDMGQQLAPDVGFAQLFAGWDGSYLPFGEKGPNGAIMPSSTVGELKLKPEPNPGQYTNRRSWAGDGWALELHTGNVAMNPKKPDQKYSIEAAVLLQAAPDGKKFNIIQEFADPATVRKGETQADFHKTGGSSKL